MKQTDGARAGFTLLELAIVVAVIGLVIGGVTAAQTMMRHSELHHYMETIEGYRTALASFETMYGANPGDLTNASAIWPDAVNGNGDNEINGGEQFQAVWQLAQAKLISGSYTGAAEPAPYTHVAGVNEEDMGGGLALRISVIDSKVYNGNKFVGNGLYIGKYTATKKDGHMMSTDEFKAFEEKLDDGYAKSGWIHGFGSSTCFDNSSVSGTDKTIYTYSTVGCVGGFALVNYQTN